MRMQFGLRPDVSPNKIQDTKIRDTYSNVRNILKRFPASYRTVNLLV